MAGRMRAVGVERQAPRLRAVCVVSRHHFPCAGERVMGLKYVRSRDLFVDLFQANSSRTSSSRTIENRSGRDVVETFRRSGAG